MTAPIYKLVADSDRFDSLLLDDAKEYKILEKLVGPPARPWWRPLTANLYRVGREGDFPYLTGHVPACSERALEALLPTLGETVEALPLEVPGKTISAMHVRPALDCLDLEASEISWLEEGVIFRVQRYVFRPDVIAGRHIFRIAQHPLAFTYVSQDFRDVVEEKSLEGLKLEQLTG